MLDFQIAFLILIGRYGLAIILLSLEAVIHNKAMVKDKKFRVTESRISRPKEDAEAPSLELAFR